MAEVFLVRDKRTGLISKLRALPYMGQNSHFERVDPAELHKSKLPPADNDDLTLGVTSGEDHR